MTSCGASSEPLVHAPPIGGRTPAWRGKVRDVFELGDRLLLVATDRVSAFDRVLPTPVPGRGVVLTALSRWWFEQTAAIAAHHMITTDSEAIAEALRVAASELAPIAGRAMLCRRAHRIDFECVVRGYLAGSGWRAYERSGAVCGVPLPPGLEPGDRLPEPIFTPATKVAAGHDVNVTFETMAEAIGRETAAVLRERALALYRHMHDRAWQRGLVLADTKIEFGWIDGEPHVIDELGTPDASRYWDRDGWERERRMDSFDKQRLRDWLASSGWRGEGPPPALPDALVRELQQRYLEVCRRLTGGERSGGAHA